MELFSIIGWIGYRAIRRVRFSFKEMKYLIFSFLHSGVETKCGVEFHHSPRNASRIRSNEGLSLCLCGIQREAEKKEIDSLSLYTSASTSQFKLINYLSKELSNKTYIFIRCQAIFSSNE